MKKLFIIFPFIFVMLFVFWRYLPGVSDYPATPKNIEVSKNDGLLLAEYTPSSQKVMINGERFIIQEAWATHFFKNRFDREVNREIYFFLVSIINEKTKERCKYTGFDSDDFIFYKGKKYGFTYGVGIRSGLQSVNFIVANKPTPPDTIVFYFKNGRSRQQVNFVKR